MSAVGVHSRCRLRQSPGLGLFTAWASPCCCVLLTCAPDFVPPSLPAAPPVQLETTNDEWRTVDDDNDGHGDAGTWCWGFGTVQGSCCRQRTSSSRATSKTCECAPSPPHTPLLPCCALLFFLCKSLHARCVAVLHIAQWNVATRAVVRSRLAPSHDRRRWHTPPRGCKACLGDECVSKAGIP